MPILGRQQELNKSWSCLIWECRRGEEPEQLDERRGGQVLARVAQDGVRAPATDARARDERAKARHDVMRSTFLIRGWRALVAQQEAKRVLRRHLKRDAKCQSPDQQAGRAGPGDCEFTSRWRNRRQDAREDEDVTVGQHARVLHLGVDHVQLPVERLDLCIQGMVLRRTLCPI